jgi:hypothetical protein
MKRKKKKRFIAGAIVPLAMLSWHMSLQGAGLSLNKSDVYPRIFSPNNDDINDSVYFSLDNPGISQITGKIYDIAGNEVASIKPAEISALNKETWVWDGRNKSGDIVPPGVYIYGIEGEGKTMSGTVVVAQ